MNYTQIDFNVLMNENAINVIKTIRSNNLLIISSKRHSEILNDLVLSAKNIFNFKIVDYNYKSEPSIEIIKDLISNIDFVPDTIVAVGGGSVIDSAKAIKALFNEDFPLRIGKKKNIVSNSDFLNVELIVIPSVVGSGAEVSSSSVILDDKKIYLASKNLVPNKIIYDLNLYKTLSDDQKIFGLGDSIVHLIESTFSKLNNGIMSLQLNNLLLNSYNNLKKIKNDSILIDDLVYSSFWGGIAQDKFLVGPVHCIAHNLSKSNLKTKHSECVSFLLPDIYMALYSENANKKQIDNIFESIGIDFEKFIMLFESTISKRSSIKSIKSTSMDDILNDPAGIFFKLNTNNIYEKFV
tara:strand:- start:4088 stop:5143 length:1056 start_codon:yes stop_codon:yes gene_type:complete